MEELASIVLTPFVLWWSLPRCAPAIVAFVRDHTAHVEGLGDVCSLAAFALPKHGNPKYGSPFKAPKVHLFCVTCMEVSLYSVHAASKPVPFISSAHTCLQSAEPCALPHVSSASCLL